MNNRKKLISGVILISMFASLAVGCGAPAEGENPTDGDNPTDGGTASSTVEVTDNSTEDELPEKDYDGYEFRIFTRANDWYRGEWLCESTGDVLDDAVYDRNAMISERFNITFSEETSDNTDTARNTILAGDDAYDVINTRCATAWTYAEEGLLVPVDELAYIDLTKAYWDKNINECLTIGDKMYFAVGANNLTGYDYTHVLVFNKDMINDNKLDNPYELVDSGAWTFEKYESMVKGITSDINGDSVMDGDDIYGYLSQPKAVLPAFWIAADVLSINKDENNYPVFTMPSDQKFISIFEQVYRMTWDNNSWFSNQSRTNYDDLLINMFQNEQALFMDITFFYIASLRDMDADFGIIPYPKYDEEQENYYSRIEGCELTCVPVTAGDLERTSIILEALACESYKSVVPAYYEIALKTKYTRDEDSSRMLDIIFENRVFDLGDTIWCTELRDGVFEGMFMNNDRALSSKFASMQTTMDEKLAKTIEAFTED